MLFNKLLLISIFCVLYVHLNGQENHGLNQQVQSKVERINLRNFGIQKRLRSDRQDRKPHNFSFEGNFAQVHSINPTSDSSFENWRDSGHGHRQIYPNSRLHSRRVLPVEIDKSSPLDWTTSLNLSELGTDRNPNIRRAFNISSNSFTLIKNKPKRNCSEHCVPKKYLQHYRAKGCEPTIDYECNCELSFDCGSLQNKNSTVCQYERRIYQIGSRIPVRNPCRICECHDFGRRRTQIRAEIDCGIGIECPESAFGIKPEPNCYFAYRPDQCCGHQVCTNTLIPKRQEKICTYNNRKFKKGQKIYPQEDSCKMCLCSDEWQDNNPLESAGCQTYSCEFELDKDFQSGCLPIYHEGSCCPIEYKCPKTFPISAPTSDPNNCLFDGLRYPLGSRLITENVCVDCICKTPPDFTCIHKSCRTPPLNCYVSKWDHSVCCQNYKCSRPESPDHTRDESQFRSNFYSNQNK